jgi:hypothetical protein
MRKWQTRQKVKVLRGESTYITTDGDNEDEECLLSRLTWLQFTGVPQYARSCTSYMVQRYPSHAHPLSTPSDTKGRSVTRPFGDRIRPGISEHSIKSHNSLWAPPPPPPPGAVCGYYRWPIQQLKRLLKNECLCFG